MEIIKAIGEAFVAVGGLFTLLTAFAEWRSKKLAGERQPTIAGKKTPTAVSTAEPNSWNSMRYSWPRWLQYLAITAFLTVSIGWSMTIEYLIALPSRCAEQDCREAVISVIRNCAEDCLIPSPGKVDLVVFVLLLGIVGMILQDLTTLIVFVIARLRRRNQSSS